MAQNIRQRQDQGMLTNDICRAAAPECRRFAKRQAQAAVVATNARLIVVAEGFLACTATLDEYLLHLHDALVEMIKNKERSYIQTAAQQEIRQRRKFLGQSSWLGELNVKVTYATIDLIATQHKLALAAMPSTTQELQPLEPCSSRFTQQLGLPCAHVILQRIQAGLTLEKRDVLSRWWLEKPLDLEGPLLRINDPDIVKNTRGRPCNNKLPVPKRLKHQDEASGTATRASRRASQEGRHTYSCVALRLTGRQLSGSGQRVGSIDRPGYYNTKL